MIKDLIILGSTGSIGTSALNVIKKNKKKFRIKLLTTKSNIKSILSQAKEFNVKTVVIHDKKKYFKFENQFKKKKIKVYFKLDDATKILKQKVYYTLNAISGLEGLYPTNKIIKHTKNIAIANKESIICGWKFIKKNLNKYNTNFIPIDSEHFSIWSLLKGENIKNVKKIYLTASGGPFINKSLSEIKNVKPNIALKHPNWKMGKKISIDSATMMNKLFEVIEAKKIFDLKLDKFSIIIHPNSYVHAIVIFKTGLSKLLVHETNMEIPILNSLCLKNEEYNFDYNEINFKKLNNMNFIKPKMGQFPLLKILNTIPPVDSYFETILISINDILVEKYLKRKISYISIHKTLLKLIKDPYFTRYYGISPRNINDIKFMVNKVKKYLSNYHINKKYEKI
tara:strand:+ start:2461 stop:3648 length:1188 start_codon:yes stop_codon:yes gene_type:complete